MRFDQQRNVLAARKLAQQRVFRILTTARPRRAGKFTPIPHRLRRNAYGKTHACLIFGRSAAWPNRIGLRSTLSSFERQAGDDCVCRKVVPDVLVM